MGERGVARLGGGQFRGGGGEDHAGERAGLRVRTAERRRRTARFGLEAVGTGLSWPELLEEATQVGRSGARELDLAQHVGASAGVFAKADGDKSVLGGVAEHSRDD